MKKTVKKINPALLPHNQNVMSYAELQAYIINLKLKQNDPKAKNCKSHT